uniref:Uncharacterized protein n=1 Tax=Avena sativa TaxID=4498 RepID=A0ACD5ZCM7_AVESA
MGMEHLMSVVNPSSGYALQKGPERHGDGTMEKMKELQRKRAETMMETYQSTESRTIRCPIPCKSSRSYREYDFKAAQDLSDFMVSKVSFSIDLSLSLSLSLKNIILFGVSLRCASTF